MALNNPDIIQSLINGTSPNEAITPSSHESLQVTKANRVTQLLNEKRSNVHAAKASLLEEVLNRKYSPKVEPTPVGGLGLSEEEQLRLAFENQAHREALINAGPPDEAWQKQLVTPPQPTPEEVEAVTSVNKKVTDITKDIDPTDFAKSVRKDTAATALEQKSKQEVFDLSAYKAKTRRAESGTDDTAVNPMSGATGRYQFMPDTWNALMKKYPDAGLTADGRINGDQQDIAMDLLTDENKINLESKGIPVTNGSMYVMHALGANIGPKILQAAIGGDTRTAAEIVGANVVKQNPTWFKNNPTSQGLVDHLSGLVDTVEPVITKPTMSEAGRKLAKVFTDAKEKKDKINEKSVTGTPVERANAFQQAEDAKKKMTGPTAMDLISDLARKGYTAAGDLYKAYDKYQSQEQAKQLEQPIQLPSTREPYYADTGSTEFADTDTSDPFSDSAGLDAFDDEVTSPFKGPTFDTEAEIEFEDTNTGLIKYKKGFWGYRDPYTNEIVSGLNRIAAESYAIYALTDREAKIAGAPEPGTIGHATNKALGAFGPTAATMAKGIRRIIGGPTTLNELAASNDINPEDIQLYRIVNKATTLTAEQEAFKNSDTYKTIARLDQKVANNIETNKHIDEFADDWKKHFPTNERNAAGAFKAYHLIAESEGTLAAVMQALKNDKATLMDMGWESVPYTLALTLGNIPVQLGLFTDLVIGMSEEAIEEWKETHNGEEPSAETAYEIMLLSGIRLAAEKASAGMLTTFLGKIPGLGGPLIWSRQVHKEVSKTISPKVTGLKTFSQKYALPPVKAVGKGVKAVAKPVVFEGGQEGFDAYMEQVQQSDAPFFSKERWTADPSKVALGFMSGGFAVFTTGTGVKVFDISAKTLVKATKAFTSESQINAINRQLKTKFTDELTKVNARLQKIANHKNIDPKVLTDFKTVDQEMQDLAAIGLEEAEIGENGELITDSAYIKEQFLAYELQIQQGELTSEEALQEIYDNIDAELQAKMGLYENLKSQIPEGLAYKDTKASVMDKANLAEVQSDIAKLEAEPELSEEMELVLQTLRDEEQRLFQKLDSPADPDIVSIDEEELISVKEQLENLLETKDYEFTWVKKGIFKKEAVPKGTLKDQSKKKLDNTITDDEFKKQTEAIVSEEEEIQVKSLPDGSISLVKTPKVAQVQEVDIPTPNVGYANIDPSGKFKTGDIVTIKDSRDPEVLASQGFKIEYFLAEQERDGKVHVKLKGKSATVPIDQLLELARPKTTDKTVLTKSERIAELAKKDLTDDQQVKYNKLVKDEVEKLEKRVGEVEQILGSSAESFENIPQQSDAEIEKKATDSKLPEVTRTFYTAELERRKAKAELLRLEQQNPAVKTLGQVRTEIIQGQSVQWKGLYTYYEEILDAYATLKDDTVVRDQKIAALRSQMETHSGNLNAKLAAFQRAAEIPIEQIPVGNVAAVVATQPDPKSRRMQYDVVTNMTQEEVDSTPWVTRIDADSTNLINALEGEVNYGNAVMDVVSQYANTPMAAREANKKELLEQDKQLLQQLQQLSKDQRKVVKEFDPADITLDEQDQVPEPTLQEQLTEVTAKANELLKIPQEERSEDQTNELEELKSTIGDLVLKIDEESTTDTKDRDTTKDDDIRRKDKTPKKSPPSPDEIAGDVRSIIKRNIKEALVTVKDSKIVRTFIEGAKDTYRAIVGDSLDTVLGLSGAFFDDLIQIGSSDKLIKGINTLQDSDFNNDQTLKEALIDLGVKSESADILITRYNDFQGRYDQVINIDLQQKKSDGTPTEVLWLEDNTATSKVRPGGPYIVKTLTVDENGTFDKNGTFVKLEGDHIVPRDQIVDAEIHALHTPLAALLRKDEFNPDNVQGRLPDQVVFALMLGVMTFKQQSPNNNRWGDKPFAKEAFLFGGKNQTLMPDEEDQVNQIGYGYHDVAGGMGSNVIKLMEFSAKKVAEDSGIDQAGADTYFENLGPALGMMGIILGNDQQNYTSDIKYFDVNKHKWNFLEANREGRIFNNAETTDQEGRPLPEDRIIGYKHITVREKTYPNKKTREALEDIIDVSGTDIDVSSGPLQKPPKTQKRIKNTFSSIFDGDEDGGEAGEVYKALEELHNVVWRKNSAMDLIADLRAYRAVLYELADVKKVHETEMGTGPTLTWTKDDSDQKIPLHHKDKMMSLTSSNQNKIDTIDELIDAYDRGELDEFYIAYELQNHHRLMQTGRINPQNSKITRFLVEAWEPQEYTIDNLWQFKLAVAQNFGIKTDKQYTFSTEINFDEIIENENVLKAVSALQQLNVAKNKKSDKDVPGASARFASAMSAVKKDYPDGNISLLNAVTGLAEYMSVTQDKRFKNNYRVEKKSSFSSSILYEIDGRSNGWAMNVLQFPMWKDGKIFWEKMNQVGNYSGKTGTPYHNPKAPGPYDDLVTLVDSGNTVDQAWQYYQDNNYLQNYPNLAPKYKYVRDPKTKQITESTEQVFRREFIKLDSALTILYPDLKNAETLRDVVKYPFIMKMYGGGIARISSDVTTEIIKEFSTVIGEVQKVYTELKKAEPNPELIQRLQSEYNLFPNGEHSIEEYYEKSVVHLANHLETLGAFEKSKNIKNTITKQKFLNSIKVGTAFDVQLNTEKLRAVISTTIAPRLDHGLDELLSVTKDPRDAIVQMGEVLHEVFIAHYEEAYKKKLIEVNEDLALKHKLSGNKSDKAPQKDTLTSSEIRNLIQDTTGDLIKVYPQFAGPLSRIANDGDYYLGFVDLSDTKFVREGEDWIEPGDKDKDNNELTPPVSASNEIIVKFKDPNKLDKVNTVRTTTSQLQFIKPGVAALIRQIINLDSAILTASMLKNQNNKYSLLTHDGIGSTPENLITFATDYNDVYKEFNLEHSIMAQTFNQVEKVLRITEETQKDSSDLLAEEATKIAQDYMFQIKKGTSYENVFVNNQLVRQRVRKPGIDAIAKKLNNHIANTKKKGITLSREKLEMGFTNADVKAPVTMLDTIKERIYNEGFTNENRDNWEERETLDESINKIRTIKDEVIKAREFIQNNSTGQFISAQMEVMTDPDTERNNLPPDVYETDTTKNPSDEEIEVAKSVKNAPRNKPSAEKTITKEWNKRVNRNKELDNLAEDAVEEETDPDDFGSIMPTEGLTVKSVPKEDDITGNNVRALFDRFTSYSSKYYETNEEQNSHTQTLSDILNILAEGFDETKSINLTYQQVSELTQGRYNVAKERMTISMSQQVNTGRNGQSPQEVYVHEMLHAMTAIAINEYPLVSARIDTLYDEVLASLTKKYGKGNEWRVFRPKGTSPVNLATEQETRAAKRQYDYIFEGKEENRLHEFLAAAATNRYLVDHMKDTIRPDKTKLIDKIMNAVTEIVNLIKSLLNMKTTSAAGPTAFAEALAITEHLVTVQNTHKSRHKQLESKTYQALDASDEILRDFANRVGKNIFNRSMEIRDRVGINPLTNFATGIINAPTLILSDDAAVVETRQYVDKILNKTLRGVANEVGGGALTPKLKEQLLQAKINISKQRQDTETFYANWFKGIWKSISPKDMDDKGMSFETREALTDVILRTDLSSLKLAGLDFMGPGSTKKIMDLVGFDKVNKGKRGKLRADIKRKLKLSGSSPAIQYAEELGYFIATGKTEKLSNPYMNAYSIAFDHMENPSEEQVTLLDAYATLSALEHTDERQTSLIKNLSKNEFDADSTNNGIIDILDTHVVYKTESRKNLFQGDPIQMVKGYIVERMDNLTDIKLGKSSEKEKMKALGYKDDYPLGRVVKDQTYDTLYINRNIPEVADISGIMSTTNQRNMGTTLTEILIRNPAYHHKGTEKPNFQLINATLNTFKTKQGALAKKLGFDPRFRFRPIRDENNKIVDYRIMMDHRSTKDILQPDLEFQNVFAHMQSRLVDKTNSLDNDIATINLLVHEQAELLPNHPEQFVDLLDPDSPYIDRFRKLPRKVREYIKTFAINDRFMVREDIIDKVFGYTQLDITQLKLFKGDGINTQKAKQIAGLTHHLIRETVGYGKNRVVLAIPQVVFGNMFSNIAQLSMRKIPIQYIFYKIIEGIQQYKKYSRDNKELAKLEHKIKTKRLHTKTSPEAIRAERLRVRMKNNKIHALREAGVDSLIVEDLNEAQIDGYWNRMKRVIFKGKYKHIGDKIPRTLQNVASTLFIAKGSVPYNFARQMVQMTDFLGRYVMIEHGTKVKGQEFKEVLHESLDAFVLFDEALLAPLEALDAVGATSFLSYWLRNQRAVNQLVKASPTSVGISALVQNVTGVPTLGNINSSWLGGDFSPNLFQFDDLFDEANNITGFEVISDFSKMLN